MSTVNATEFKRLLDADPALVVIDVRTPAEFAEVHVGAARNEPLGDFDPAKLRAAGVIPESGPVYLLCRSGKRAQTAAELVAQGVAPDRAVVVEGGTLAWIEAGFPVVRGKAAGIDLERQVRIFAGTLVLTGTLLGVFVHPGFLAIPGFVGAGLVFAGITGFCGAGLLLAKLPFNRK